ncbi:hypothetical protein ACFL3U_00430 [Pseudomonadota bacterium]
MKHVFLLLLAVNIGLFVWGYQREQAAEHKRPYSHDIGELRLLTERKATLKPKLQQNPAPEQKELMPATEVEVAALELGSSESDFAPESEEKEAERQSSVEKAEYEDSQIAQQEMVDQNAATSDDDILTSNLSEVEPKQQAELDLTDEIDPELQAEMVVEPELLTPKLVCYRLGPVLEIAAVEELSEQLVQLGFNAVMHTQQVKKTKGYWVMYPALETYEQAKQKLQEMKELGLTDLWLFPKGEHKNSISLGLYSRRVNAEIANKRAQKKGLGTEVLIREVKFDQYWLEFQDIEQLSISEESRLALQEAYSKEEFEFKRCSNVVTD